MAVLSHLQPRDRELAARVVSTLAAVAGGVTILFASIAPDQQGATDIGITIITSFAAVVVAVLLRRLRNRGAVVWGVFPLAAIAVITALDVLTRDASVSAQVFFLFPALYAAFQLHRRGAIAVGLAAIAGDLIDVFALLPPREAIMQSGYLIAAIATSMTLLVLSGERQDLLVAQLQHQAAVDSLTGLVTRRVLDRAAAAAMSASCGKLGTGLILLDIDHFKAINDEYGHPAGDEVLIQLAGLLLRDVRPSDTVSRLGGDEIAVLLADCPVEIVMRRAEEILREVRLHRFEIESGALLRVSISVGVAHLPTHATDLRTLYGAADTSLYAAKRDGRNKIGPLPPNPLALTA
jgi:diguanylate cyclase (GGDEF)-like protein